MTIFGWDASAWDYDRGLVDVAAAARDGISFITAKATEGVTFTDPRYARTAAKAHGVVPLFGAYHVLHPARISPISAQVDHYLAVLDARSPWWRSGPFLIQLDCERWAASDFPDLGDIRAWCDVFTARTGGRWTPVVYASRGQYGDSLTGLGRPLWNANYGGDPTVHYRSGYPGDSSPRWAAYSGAVPAILQYGSLLAVGTQPGCDANAYRGSLAQLRALAGGPGSNTTNTPTESGSLEDEMPAPITASVPAGFAFTVDPATGKVTEVPGTDQCRLVLAVPAGARAGLPWGGEYLSFTCDLMGRGPVRLRVAIHDGAGWAHIDDHVVVPSGGRVSVPIPPPANGTAYTIAVGRVRQSEHDDSVAQPVGVLVELGVR
jgi:hypothetical protein